MATSETVKWKIGQYSCPFLSRRQPVPTEKSVLLFLQTVMYIGKIFKVGYPRLESSWIEEKMDGACEVFLARFKGFPDFADTARCGESGSAAAVIGLHSQEAQSTVKEAGQAVLGCACAYRKIHPEEFSRPFSETYLLGPIPVILIQIPITSSSENPRINFSVDTGQIRL
jgi:hypothetical protein